MLISTCLGVVLGGSQAAADSVRHCVRMWGQTRKRPASGAEARAAFWILPSEQVCGRPGHWLLVSIPCHECCPSSQVEVSLTAPNMAHYTALG